MQKISYHLNETCCRQVFSACESDKRPVRSTTLLRTHLDRQWSGFGVMDQEQHIEPALATFTEEEREQAMARYAVLRPHIDEGIPLSEAARDAGVPLRSVQRWLARYRASGLVGLARMKRSDTGKRKLPAELVDLIEGMALRKPRPSVATIHRRMTALAAKRKWTPPSYGSVYGIVRHLNPAMVTLAQDGPAAFRDCYELIYRHRAECPNATWQADHTLLDILVLDANGAALRPWLTIVIDDYSRAVAGYTLFLGAPTALQTALALRQAIWNKHNAAWPICGIPDVLHVDHGSDFTSTHLEQVAADLHFQLVYSTVGRPQGRGRLSASSGRSTRNVSPTSQGILARENPPHPLGSPSRNSMPPLVSLFPGATITTAPIVKLACHPLMPGLAKDGCRVCRRVWKLSICYWSWWRSLAWFAEMACTFRGCVISILLSLPMSASR